MKSEQKDLQVVISPPNIQKVSFELHGTSPFVQLRFNQKTKNMLLEKMADASKAKKSSKNARNYEQEFIDSMYITDEGWRGIPAAAFRKGLISACRTVNFKMTLAKLSVFVEADGFDSIDGTPLVRIRKGEPKLVQHACRNATGVVDIRTRAMWEKWTAILKVQFDADQFTVQDITNLLIRVGLQVGVGEGRPDSKSSAGMGWGLFDIVTR